MKRAIFTSALSVLLFTACQKQDSAFRDEEPQSSIATASVSGWQEMAPADWQLSADVNGDAAYRYNLSSPDLVNALAQGSTILAFVRGYSFSEPSINKPMGFPFAFFSTNERIHTPYNWTIEQKVNALSIGLTMSKEAAQEFEAAKNAIEVRYAILTAAQLKQLGVSKEEISRLSYSQLMGQLGDAL